MTTIISPKSNACTKLRHGLMELLKVRLNTMVVTTAVVGYLLVHGQTDWGQLHGLALGTFALASAASIMNQVIEQSRDALMQRTAHRPLVTGQITPTTARYLGLVLALVGSWILVVTCGYQVAALGLGNFLLYTLVYTSLKPISTTNTLVGAICGAVPPVMGWIAAGGSWTGAGGWLLGLLLFAWQIPHFLALAWLYQEDYLRGGFKMLASNDADGITTGRMMILYSLALVPIGLIAILVQMVGWFGGGVACLMGMGMVLLAIKFSRKPSLASARKLFLYSVIYLPVVLLALVVDRTAADATAQIALNLLVSAPR